MTCSVPPVTIDGGLSIDYTYAVIGCGSRSWVDSVGSVIPSRIGRYPCDKTVVIHGDYGAADEWIDRYARGNGYMVVPVPYFSHLGRGGGPARNRAMLYILQGFARRGMRVAVEAFDLGTDGTRNMLNLAKDARVPAFATRPCAPGEGSYGFKTVLA